MSLPTCQQRILERIEGELAKSDPRLTALFLIFARLTRSEAMPRLEQLTVRPLLDLFAHIAAWFRRLHRRRSVRARAMVLFPAAVTAMACALTLAIGFAGNHRPSSPGANKPIGRELIVKHRLCRVTLARVPVLSC
jgi:hypothetical protein